MCFVVYLSHLRLPARLPRSLRPPPLPSFPAEKVCQLSYARIQGKDALTTHFQNSMLLLQEDKNFRPVLFNSETGEPEEFPIQARPRRGSRSSMDWPKTGRKSGGGPARASADGMGPPGMRREVRSSCCVMWG